MTEVEVSEIPQLQYVHGPQLKTCHVVAIKMRTALETGSSRLVGVKTGCGHLMRIVDTNRKLTEPGAAPPEGHRLCKKCEEALVWWRHKGTWAKDRAPLYDWAAKK